MRSVAGSRIFVVLAVVLVGVFLVGVWAQRDIGLADNSDFTRSIFTFSSGPVGLPMGWPAYDSEVGRQRFFYYWLPRWNLRWFLLRPITSAELLWVPGVLVAAVSGGIIDLRVVSLFPKLLLLGEMLLVIAWAWRQTAHRFTLLFALGVPTVLVFTTTDYLVYLQSFYQEAGTLVFLLPVLFALVYFRRQPSRTRLAVVLVCVGLLTTAKRADFYWPLLTLPFLLSAWLAGHAAPRETPRRLTVVAVGLLCAVVATVASLRATSFGATGANAYQSFFFGALTFSDHPAAHLERCGLQTAAACVNHDAYSPVGRQYLVDHPNDVTFRHVLLTYARDPGAVVGAVRHVSGNMQDLSLEFLGKYALGDPRIAPDPTPVWRAATERFRGAGEGTIWNGWSACKYWWFPTGGTLFACLGLFAGWFGWQWLRASSETARELAMVGLVATLACPLDMGVAVLGEGRADLIKHLFLANLTFDVAAVVFFASVLVWARTRFGPPVPA